jgi:hypothetical protein
MFKRARGHSRAQIVKVRQELQMMSRRDLR